MSSAVSIGVLPRSLATAPSVLPTISVLRGLVNKIASAPLRRFKFASISAIRRGRTFGSFMRLTISASPPASAQRGTSAGIIFVPEAVYGYWLAVTSIPSRRAFLIRRTAWRLCPQTSLPSALICEMWTGIFASRPMLIVSRIAPSKPIEYEPSSRRCVS